MEFAWSAEQETMRRELARLLRRFPDAYWLAHDRDHRFPESFYQAMAEGGWLGVAMPTEHGGSGLGITEAALILQEVAASGACFSGASAVHMNIFGVNPLVRHGSPAQQASWLPAVIDGHCKVAFAVTEPDAGLDTTRISTTALREGPVYRVNGKKVWISTAQVAHKLLLLARTTPLDQVGRPTEGLSLFFTDLNREAIQVREIDKAGRAAVDSNELFIDDLLVPAGDRLGAEGEGFKLLLDGLNPERILIAAEAIGIGRAALAKASDYAKSREVFGRPIGQNQAVQHPLAALWCRLEAANLLTFKAAWLYDQGQPCGAEANAAKYLGAEAGYAAADQAMQTLGGMGYAREFHVERYWREAKIARIAPVSSELILCYIAERVLGLPKSY